jgi:hypothetical protein
MNPSPHREALINYTLDHYMEKQALICARAKARTDRERAAVERLIHLRNALMEERARLRDQFTTKRHARGEFYSDAKVAAINAMGYNQAELDQCVKACYESQEDAMGVLKSHARTAFGHGLISQRSLLAHAPDDIVALMRESLALEETFATEWLNAIDDTAFLKQIQQVQREAMVSLRTSSSGMYLVTEPAYHLADAVEAAKLGQAWNKLDALARELGVPELSEFIGIDGQSYADGSTAEKILSTVEALLETLQDSKRKLPSKKLVCESLRHIRDTLRWLHSCEGRAYFEIDF